jgi:hypothetical protein
VGYVSCRFLVCRNYVHSSRFAVSSVNDPIGPQRFTLSIFRLSSVSSKRPSMGRVVHTLSQNTAWDVPSSPNIEQHFISQLVCYTLHLLPSCARVAKRTQTSHASVVPNPSFNGTCKFLGTKYPSVNYHSGPTTDRATSHFLGDKSSS